MPAALYGKPVSWGILQGSAGQGVFRKWADANPADGKNDLADPYQASLTQTIPTLEEAQVTKFQADFRATTPGKFQIEISKSMAAGSELNYFRKKPAIVKVEVETTSPRASFTVAAHKDSSAGTIYYKIEPAAPVPAKVVLETSGGLKEAIDVTPVATGQQQLDWRPWTKNALDAQGNPQGSPLDAGEYTLTLKATYGTGATAITCSDTHDVTGIEADLRLDFNNDKFITVSDQTAEEQNITLTLPVNRDNDDVDSEPADAWEIDNANDRIDGPEDLNDLRKAELVLLPQNFPTGSVKIRKSGAGKIRVFEGTTAQGTRLLSPDEIESANIFSHFTSGKLSILIEAVTPGEVTLDLEYSSGGVTSSDSVKLGVINLELIAFSETDGELPAEDFIFTSDPRPEVTLNIQDAKINSAGDLEVDINITVEDRLSEFADSPTDRVQTLFIELNETPFETVGNLPSLASGTPVLPWRPNPFTIRLTRHYVIQGPGPSCFIFKAHTSPNAAGNVGWDSASVVVNLEDPPELTPGGTVTDTAALYPTISQGQIRYYARRVVGFYQHEGSMPSSFTPYVIRVEGPFPEDLTQTQVVVRHNGQIQTLKSFEFSPKKFYVVDQDDQGRPAIFILTVSDQVYPWGEKKVKQVQVMKDILGKWVVQIVDDAGVRLFEVSAITATDAYKQTFVEGSPPEGRLTLEGLLAAYDFLYEDLGRTLLQAFSQDNPNNEIVLQGVTFDLKTTFDTDTRVGTIFIENDLDPIKGAALLFAGLGDLLPNYIRSLPAEFFTQNFNQVREVTLQAAGRKSAAFLEAFQVGLQVISEPADLVVSAVQLSQGELTAIAGIIPFIPGGRGFILRLLDGTTVLRFSAQAVRTIQNALEAASRAAKAGAGRIAMMDVIRAGIRNGDLTSAQVKGLIDLGYIKEFSGDHCRKILRAELGTPPRKFINPHAHHDMPVKFQKDFLAHGFDINKAEFGRYVEGNPPGRHLNWSGEFEDEWTEFWRLTDPINEETILRKMNDLRGDPRFQ